MSNDEILLGYEVGTANSIYIRRSHLIATGITQLSGKTTTIEALITRSKKRAIVFKTKVGETGFTQGTVIPPYFKEKSDWQYVSSLLEATLKEKLKFERAWIIQICKGTDSLLQVKANIDKKLVEGKSTSSLSYNVYTTLQAYFDMILPQLQYANFSRTLEIRDGINIMDLERYSEEIQSLIIRSVLETVLQTFKDVIVVLPEAWKFLPQGRGNPCKFAAESFIRQGATNGNFLWIDSQDMAGMDKTPLKQVSTWILGLQQERNEVEHTLDQIPLPRKQKPKTEEIMSLKKGHFILATPDATKKVYVQPAWMDTETAKKIAIGEIEVDTVSKPENLMTITVQAPPQQALSGEDTKFYSRVTQDMIQMRKDFFAKIDYLQNLLDAQGKAIIELKTKASQPISTDEITSLVMQKIHMPNKQEIIDELVKRIPKMTGTVTYEVAPLEALQKEFQEKAKTEIYGYIRGLDEDQKTILKYLEALGKPTTLSDIITKALFKSATSGGQRTQTSNKITEMATLELIFKDGNGFRGNLKQKLTKHMEPFNATPQEIEVVYTHIVAEMLQP